MMKITLSNLFLSSLILVLNFSAFAQKYAQSSGSWSSVTWSSDKAGLIPSPGTPTATDDVYTNGRAITVSTAATCRNLAVTYNVSGGLVFAGSGSLTVTGAMFGWNDSSDSFAGPTVNVFNGSTITVAILFTGANHDGFGGQLFDNEVISNWNSNSPIARVTINTPIATTFSIDNDGANSIAITQLFIQGSTNLKTSFFNFPISPANAGLEISTVFSMASAANIFDCAVPIRGTPTFSSRTSTATINGTLITSSYFNASTFNMGASGVLRTSFAGSDQTTGWWYQSASPTAGSINASSTVSFEADVAQNVPARVFGNLFLDAASPVTKTLGSGTLNVNGNLTINSSGITFNTNSATAVSIGGNLSNSTSWAPAISVTFNGLTGQSISGSGTTIFAGGLTINKASGTLTLNQNISVQNGLTITSGTLDLGSNTLSLSGNLSNSGTLIASASTLNITGSSSFSGSVLTLNNLTISGTGSLTAPATLNIAGNFTNNGSFNANGGVLIFNGSAPQTIGGSTVTSFYDVTTSNAVSLTSPQNLTGILTVSSNTFTTNNNLTLVSTASSDAMIGNSAGTVSGNVTVQKYLNNTVKSYRYLSSPVVGATAAAWKSSFPITGTFNDPSTQGEWPGIPGIVQASPSMYSYNEPAGGALGARFASFPANGTSTSGATLVSGTGYAAFIRQTSPITLSVNGTVRQGTNVQINLTNTSGDPTDDGWNLIGNPFPAPLNWSTVTIPPNVSGTMSLKDNNGILVSPGSYVTCAGGACTPGSYNGIIPIGQAFWVRRMAVGTGPITFSESNKSTTRNPTFLRTETIANLLRAKLSGNGREDELVVRLATGASDAADNKFDGFKLNNDFLNFYSVSIDGQKLAINGAAPLTAEQSIKSFPLRIEGNGNWVVSPGSYRISITEIESFDSGIEIYLKDAYLKDSLMVSQKFEYNFSTVTDPKSYKDRFSLIIGRPSVTTAASDDSANGITKIYPNPTNGEFTIETEQSADKTATILNSIGQRIGKVDLTPSEKWLVGTWDLATQPEGVYFVQIVNGKKVQTKKIVKK